MSTERIVVQRAIADEFRQKVAANAEKLFGKDAPALGLVNAAAVTKNKKLVADAVVRKRDAQRLEIGHGTRASAPLGIFRPSHCGQPVDRRGLVHENDVAALMAFRKKRLSAFAHDLARGCHATATNVLAKTDAELLKTIAEGSELKGMPAFGAIACQRPRITPCAQ